MIFSFGCLIELWVCWPTVNSSIYILKMILSKPSWFFLINEMSIFVSFFAQIRLLFDLLILFFKFFIFNFSSIKTCIIYLILFNSLTLPFLTCRYFLTVNLCSKFSLNIFHACLANLLYFS